MAKRDSTTAKMREISRRYQRRKELEEQGLPLLKNFLPEPFPSYQRHGVKVSDLKVEVIDILGDSETIFTAKVLTISGPKGKELISAISCPHCNGTEQRLNIDKNWNCYPCPKHEKKRMFDVRAVVIEGDKYDNLS